MRRCMSRNDAPISAILNFDAATSPIVVTAVHIWRGGASRCGFSVWPPYSARFFYFVGPFRYGEWRWE